MVNETQLFTFSSSFFGGQFHTKMVSRGMVINIKIANIQQSHQHAFSSKLFKVFLLLIAPPHLKDSGHHNWSIQRAWLRLYSFVSHAHKPIRFSQTQSCFVEMSVFRFTAPVHHIPQTRKLALSASQPQAATITHSQHKHYTSWWNNGKKNETRFHLALKSINLPMWALCLSPFTNLLPFFLLSLSPSLTDGRSQWRCKNERLSSRKLHTQFTCPILSGLARGRKWTANERVYHRMPARLLDAPSYTKPSLHQSVARSKELWEAVSTAQSQPRHPICCPQQN